MASQPVVGMFAELSARTAKFHAGFKKGREEVRRFSRKSGRSFETLRGKVKKLSKSLFSLKGGIIALAGPAVLGALIVSSLDTADAIAKTADKVGLHTDELQEMRFAANRAGVAHTALDMGMQRFSRRMGEVAQGMGSALAVSKQYGIQVTDNEGRMRSNMDIMGDWAEVIKNTESEQEQLRIAFQLFDSEGAALVNLLRLGRDGMDEMRQKARDLSLVLSEDMVRDAEGAKDAISDLTAVVKIGFTKAVLGNAKAIEDLTLKLAEGLPKLISWVKEFAKFVGLVKETPTEMEKLEAEYQKQAEALRVNKQAFIDVRKQINQFGKDTEANREKLEHYSTNIETATANIEILEKQMDALGDESQELAQTDLPAVATSTAEYDAAVALLIPDVDSLTFKLREMKRATDDAGGGADDAADGLDAMASSARRAGRVTGDAFSGVIAKGDDVVEVFERMAVELGIIVVKALVFQAIMAAITGGGGTASSATAGFVKGLFGFAQGGVFDSGRLQRFGSGGIVSRPTMFAHGGGVGIMGEAGTEAIMPLTRMAGGDLGVKADMGGVEERLDQLIANQSNAVVVPADMYNFIVSMFDGPVDDAIRNGEITIRSSAVGD
ncbi:MAG: hypothetical protein IIA59_00680 [Candidatus Marinimicrobia bacterium]|nr:hypothetical protein [Candidatus Neomarinimicrobiota bacterium]